MFILLTDAIRIEVVGIDLLMLILLTDAILIKVVGVSILITPMH